MSLFLHCRLLIVHASDELDDLLWDSVGSEDVPQATCISVYTVKGFLKVYKVDVQLPLPLCALLYDVT